MPYRRLPNTDESRLKALKQAVQQEERQAFGTHVINFKTLHEAKSFLQIFEKQLVHYRLVHENQVNANKRYQQIVSNLRMYVSHFIQVFNLSVIRGEIKKEHKLLYHLEPDQHVVPDLNSEQSLLHWGKCVIDGENERIRKGGLPIYNPAIAKVRVHYDIFKEYKATQMLHRQSTGRNLEEISQLRGKGDDILLNIWNQVENHFKDETPYERIEKCKAYGLRYYYRTGEKKLQPAHLTDSVKV